MTVGGARMPMAVVVDVLACFAGAALFVGLFTRGGGTAPSLAAVAAVALASFALSRWLQEADFEEETMRRISVVASAVGVAIVAQLEYGRSTPSLMWLGEFLDRPLGTLSDHGEVALGVVALAAVWLRGLLRGRSEVEADDVLSAISLGLLAMIGAALVQPQAAGPAPWGALAVGYAAFAFLTLALYRSVEPEMPLARFAARWAPAMAAVVALSLLAGAAFVVFPADDLSPPTGVLAVIGNGLIAALVFVLTPVFLLISWILSPVGWLLDQLPQREFRPRLLEEADEEEPRDKDRGSSPWLRALQILLTAGITALLIAIALAIVWYATRRFARRAAGAPERRGAVEPAPVANELGDLLSSLGRLFRRPGRPRSAVAIRRLYFEMLDAAAERGTTRPPAVTPMQFAPELDDRFRSSVPSMISQAFVDSRYGQRSIDEGRVRDLRARWSETRARDGWG